MGGLIGYATSYSSNHGEISQSFATGNVTAESTYAGGLVGFNSLALVSDSYARGSVNGALEAGGIVGYNDMIFENSYSTGVVSSTSSYVGGLVASQGEAEMRHSFWDTQTSTQSTSGGGTGLTTAQMKNIQSFTTDLGEDSWDFSDIWYINPAFNDGYPCLQWYGACQNEGGNDGDSDSDSGTTVNNGDGNNDGIADDEQDNVVTLISPVSNAYVTVATDDSCTLSDVSIASASGHTSQDSAYSYQSGFVNFTATGCADDVANVKLYYHGVSPADLIARKYNPNTDTYFTINDAAITASAAPIAGTMVSYAVYDNGELDINDADGVITDPVGLASNPASAGASADMATAATAPDTGYDAKNPVGYAIAMAIGIALVISGFAPLRNKAAALIRSKQ